MKSLTILFLELLLIFNGLAQTKNGSILVQYDNTKSLSTNDSITIVFCNGFNGVYTVNIDRKPIASFLLKTNESTGMTDKYVKIAVNKRKSRILTISQSSEGQFELALDWRFRLIYINKSKAATTPAWLVSYTNKVKTVQ